MRAGIALGTICAVLLLASCGAHAKREWLTFFFDGVPPETDRAATASGPASGPEGARAVAPADNQPAAAGPARVLHKPYGDRRCDACHESGYSQKLRGRVDEVCLLCHKTVFAGALFRHAPAEAGYCLGCHHPHESGGRYLLLQAGQRMCRDCHDEMESAGAKAAHAVIGETACQECHAPHGGGNILYLKSVLPKTPVPRIPAKKGGAPLP